MKRVENRIENLMGDRFRSRYAMVCYGGEGNVTYRNAYNLGPVIQGILEELCSHMHNSTDDTKGNLDTDDELEAQIELVDWELASKLVDERLLPELQALEIDLSTVKH